MTFELICQWVASAVITGLVGYLWGIAKDKKREYDEELKEKELTQRKLVETCEALVKWRVRQEKDTEQLYRALEKLSLQMDKMRDGGMSLLRDRIIQSCRFFISQDCIHIEARDNITMMYKSYKNLGGNGVCSEIYANMMTLKVVGLPQSVVPRVDIDCGKGNKDEGTA